MNHNTYICHNTSKMILFNSITYYKSVVIFLTLTQLVLAENELFKINKMNLIWAKAQHSLGETKLKDLKRDLSKHEFDELTLKKMKTHNQDKDGLFEASVRKKLLSIMKKYSLERYYDDIHPPIEKEHDLKRDNLDKIKKEDSMQSNNLKYTFRDKKLDKLWKKAEQSGFTQDQLMVLHDEFQHQQEKLDEHYDIMANIEQEIETKSFKAMREQNSIENTLENETGSTQPLESPSDKKARLYKNLNQELKEKYSGIKRDIEKLHSKISSGKIETSQGPFEEQSVNQLWEAAVQTNFTSSELESFKEELEHYEVRIKKLRHFRVQLERNNVGFKNPLSQDDEDDDTKHIRRKVHELTSKVDTIQKNLEKRISMNRREEL